VGGLTACTYPVLLDRMPEWEASCSFCHRPKSEVGKLIESDNDAYICNYCVALSYSILVEEGVDVKLHPRPPGVTAARGGP
jgi:hypothetical protein